MSVTTLEEVFINVAHGTKTQNDAEKGLQQLESNQMKSSAVVAAEIVDPESQTSTIQFSRLDEKNQLQYFFRHMYAMFMKRYLYFIRDKKTWFLQIFLPVLFVMVGMFIMNYTSYIETQPSKTITPHFYNSEVGTNYNPWAYNTGSYFCPPESINSRSGNIANGTCYAIDGQDSLLRNISAAFNWPLNPISYATTIKDVSEWLSVHKDDNKAMQVGAVTYVNTSFINSHVSNVSHVVHSNFTAVHGAMVATIIADNGIIKSINPSASLSMSIHPLPLSGRETSIFESFNANLIATFLLLAIPFIPAAWITYVVREREVKAKHVQLVSGVSVLSYWLATWLWDFLAYQLTMW